MFLTACSVTICEPTDIVICCHSHIHSGLLLYLLLIISHCSIGLIFCIIFPSLAMQSITLLKINNTGELMMMMKGIVL